MMMRQIVRLQLERLSLDERHEPTRPIGKKVTTKPRKTSKRQMLRKLALHEKVGLAHGVTAEDQSRRNPPRIEGVVPLKYRPTMTTTAAPPLLPKKMNIPTEKRTMT